MKKTFIIILFLILVISSCKKEAVLSNEEITAKKLEGTWQVYSHFVKGAEFSNHPNDSTYIYPTSTESLSFTNIEKEQGSFKRTPELFSGFNSTFIIIGKSFIELTEDTDFVRLFEIKLTDDELIIFWGYNYYLYIRN